ncbi:MAG: tyrosine-type recombinase/integrase [Myxococcales bacterium]|nr:tyrosine-type recombinase/integrase [Myxococcales bacterium]
MNQITDNPFDQPIRHRRASTRTKAARVLEKAVRGAAGSRPYATEIGDAETMAGNIASVYGPYPNGDKWRLVLRSPDGRRKSKIVDTFEEAQRIKARVAADLADEAQTIIRTAIEEFLAAKRKQGLRACSVRVWADRLALLPQDIGVRELSPSHAQALYDQWIETVAVATHRARLRFVRSFFAWAIERGYLTVNPFAKVKPVGKPRRGKLQLRVDEARKLYAELFRLAWAGESTAGCLLVQILHGARSSEVWGLRVRDIDADATRLHIAAEGGKTVNATRTLEIDVPELRALLLHLRQSKQPSNYLFARRCAITSTNNALYKYLHRLCDRLSIPRVCPHSLRGLHATVAVQSGVTSRAVAGVLGHASDEITRLHYIAPGSDSAGNARSLAALLAPAEPPKPALSPSLADLLNTIRTLSPEDRAILAATVGGQL